MKIDFEGRTWQLDLMDVSMEQGLAIQAYTGLTPLGWEKSLALTEDPVWLKSVRCLYWLMLAQNGENVPLESVNFSALKFYKAFGDGNGEDAAAQEPEDPTRPAGGGAAGPPATTAAAG